MFVGLVGPMGSGKSTVVEMTGFKSVSLTEVLKEEARRREIEIGRSNLISLGNQLRLEKGEHVLAKLAVETISKGNYAIDSIRNPEEVKFLMENLTRFVLIAVNAPSEVRWRRTQKKYEEIEESAFEEIDKRDRDIGIDESMNLADFYIENVDMEKTFGELKKILEMRKVVGLVGMAGSGKSAVQSVFARNGFSTFNMGDVVTKMEMEKRGWGGGEELERKIAKELRDELGKEAIAIKTFSELKDEKGDICIAGLRSEAEADYFRKMWGDKFVLVSIEAGFERRVERMKKRLKRPYKSREELASRDERERGYGLGELFESCKKSVKNEGTLKDLEKEVVSLINGL